MDQPSCSSQPWALSSVHCDTDESRLKVVASSQSKGNMFIFLKRGWGAGVGMPECVDLPALSPLQIRDFSFAELEATLWEWAYSAPTFDRE